MSALWQVAWVGEGEAEWVWTNNLRAAHLSLVVLPETTHSGKSIHSRTRECPFNVCSYSNGEEEVTRSWSERQLKEKSACRDTNTNYANLEKTR